MAKIVLAIGTSHGPTIQTPPEEWRRLGEGDTRDPRYDYNALLKRARPGLDQEITLDKQQQRYEAAHSALGHLKEQIQAAKPSVMLVVSNAHQIRPDDNHAVFSVYRGASLPVALHTGPFDPDARFRPDAERPKPTLTEKPAHPALGQYLIEALIERDFDVACSDRMPEGSALDEAFAFPYEWLLDGADLPMVPFQLSRYLPYQATPARCHAMGGALREAVEAWPAGERVMLVASGGLSHQIIDEELDRRVIEGLEKGDRDNLTTLPRERLNGAPGTPEILNWVTVSAAMAPKTMRLVDYLPCYRSLAGTGHALTFGYWEGR
ncbi:MAG: hypothetical protein WD533_04680 [Dehalococcoidia bacterium]